MSATVGRAEPSLFLRMPEDRRRELERRYSTARDAFERVRAAVAAEEAEMEHGRT